MINLNLNGKWNMHRQHETDSLSVNVPGSVFNDLLTAGKIEDPFYKLNEHKAKEIASHDYVYERSFTVSKELLEMDRILLCCDGIDTLSLLQINGKEVGETCNMHTRYEYDIKNLLIPGENRISITLFSPTAYIAKKNEEQYIWGANDAMAGFPYIRKAHSSFGWDWGPQIPDSGIWRSISIKGFKEARIHDVYITQQHETDKVLLSIKTEAEKWGAKSLVWKAEITAPDGKTFHTEIETSKQEGILQVQITEPKLWWPNNFGKQYLYQVKLTLAAYGKELDGRTMNIGLRTLTVRKEKDEYGESFEFHINGKSIFAMGADYIPEDSLLARCSPERTERLIRDCVRANYNSIRVWGGGIYPEDYFFDLCDQYGLIVWQDLMYACAVYDMTEEFTENITRETIDNVKRIRHHASLGLWCGNNEMEWGWMVWGFPKTAKLKTDYIKQFEILLPSLVKKYDPNTFYWPASPSSGGGFEDPNNENIGDVHYWDVWHGLKPFTEYRKFFFRFVSEFGFQSFPEFKTVESFSTTEDWNIFSDVMENHQKNGSANGIILYYLSQNLKYPKDFKALLYASQILQAEAIKYGVEHWRRNRGRCMGAIYWQINDCWPVASWSSLDYFGRWKALHYYAKRFFKPVLLSAEENGSQVKLNVSNETLAGFTGKLAWKLRDNRYGVISKGFLDVEVASLSAATVESLDFGEYLNTEDRRKETYLEYALVKEDEVVGSGALLFAPMKHFRWLNPEIETVVVEKEKHFEITLTSKAFAYGVMLGLREFDGVFSNNFFHLSGGKPYTVYLEKAELSKGIDCEELLGNLEIQSIYDMA